MRRESGSWGRGIVRHMSRGVLESRRVASRHRTRHVEPSMNRTDTLPPDIELAQLLQRCAAADTAAFRALYDKTSPILFARLLRMLRRRSVAEEALQDVFVRIWQRAAQFEVAPGPRTRLDGDHRALLRDRSHAPRAHDAGRRTTRSPKSPTNRRRTRAGSKSLTTSITASASSTTTRANA